MRGPSTAALRLLLQPLPQQHPSTHAPVALLGQPQRVLGVKQRLAQGVAGTRQQVQQAVL